MIAFVDKGGPLARETGGEVKASAGVRLGCFDNTPTACQREAGAISDNAETERV